MAKKRPLCTLPGIVCHPLFWHLLSTERWSSSYWIFILIAENNDRLPTKSFQPLAPKPQSFQSVSFHFVSGRVVSFPKSRDKTGTKVAVGGRYAILTTLPFLGRGYLRRERIPTPFSGWISEPPW